MPIQICRAAVNFMPNESKQKKSTDQFKATILEKLTETAKSDKLFGKCFRKKNKNIDDCITYILETVQKSGCCGFTDDEVYGIAMHYYDEDEIETGKAVNYQVIVNHQVQLTAEEIAEAKKEARSHIFTEETRRLKPTTTVNKKPSNPESTVVQQASLF